MLWFGAIGFDEGNRVRAAPSPCCEKWVESMEGHRREETMLCERAEADARKATDALREVEASIEVVAMAPVIMEVNSKPLQVSVVEVRCDLEAARAAGEAAEAVEETLRA